MCLWAGSGPGCVTCITGVCSEQELPERGHRCPCRERIGAGAWTREGGEMQGYAEHILNMAVQNGILQKHEQFFEALIFGKIRVEEEEGLPCKYCLFFSDRG